jgi:phage baseplate assembly protein W
MATKKYAPQIPFETDNNGDFIKIDDSLANVKQKLKMLILTNPGEKLMEPEFGVGIRKYLFESVNGVVSYNLLNGKLDTITIQDIQQKLSDSINEQVAKYSNDITIYSVQASVEEQTLNVSIGYNYKGFLNDTLELAITV